MAKRIFVGIIGLGLLVLGLRGIWGTLIAPKYPGDNYFFLIIHLPLLIVAGFCLWYAASEEGTANRRRISCALRIGLIVGGFTFAAFFVGPIIFTPEANQGPLAGFLFAPAGYAAGVLIGACFPGLCEWLGPRRIRK